MSLATTRDISLNNLLLDHENPRLADVQGNQRETIRVLLASLGDKIVNLAADIQSQGVDPTQLLLVMPEDEKEKRFIVLEGNRRLAALKLLENPDLADGVLSKSQYDRLRKLSQQFARHPMRSINCAVVQTREDADHWINLRHTGERQGAGIVPWGATESARFSARRGKDSAALKVLEFVRTHAGLNEEIKAKLGKLSLTNLQRLINDPYVRGKLGFDKQKEEILLHYPDKEVAKGLGKIVRDLVEQRIVVSNIDTKEQRKEYIDKFGQEVLPNKATKLNATRSIGSHNSGPSTTGTNTSKSAKQPLAPRKTLIPKSCAMTIASPRINNIFRELRRLKIEDFPNAAGVLLRVFVELTVDDHLTRKNIGNQQQRENSKLRDKISMVATYFEQNAVMTSDELAPVKRAIQDQHFLAASVKTMHSYVHNQHFNPSAGELRAAWDNLELFLQKICS